MKTSNKILSIYLPLLALGLFLLSPTAQAQVEDKNAARVDTSNAGLVVKVAPGELLPVSIKLANFGGGERVDVYITYSIFSSTGNDIYTTSETVAVETTANFVKTIQVPMEAQPGSYTARTSIIYAGQLVPGLAQFPFTIERKILGIFQSDFILFSGIISLVSIFMLLIGHALVKRGRLARSTPLDYSSIPHDKRAFFELISDTVLEMRQQVGEDAMEIAKRIEGLYIDDKTGRILKLTKSPSKIVADLALAYEQALNKKVSFFFRRS